MPDARLLVEFLNTLDLRTFGAAARVLQRDSLGSPGAARDWLIRHEVLGHGENVDDDSWRLVLRVREVLRASVGAGAAATHEPLDDASLHLAVRIAADGRPVLEPAGPGVPGALARLLAIAVLATIDGSWGRIKTCAAEDCRRVFYDASKNRSGRWCSARVCGNRMRTRSYRRRRSTPAPPQRSQTATTRRARSRENVLRRDGDVWRIAYGHVSFRLRDSKGLRHLARLLADPGREWHVLDLVATETDAAHGHAADRIATADGLRRSRGGDAGPLLDDAAKDAYRRRVEDLREAIEEGRVWGDHERAARAEEELHTIATELARSVGLGGRDRRAASDAERARINVTRTIRAALVRIDEHSPELAHHLRSTVRTGMFCSYDPDPRLPVSWRF